MNCQFKYLDSTNQWVAFGRIVSPLKIGDTIKAEATTAYSVSLYFKGITKDWVEGDWEHLWNLSDPDMRAYVLIYGTEIPWESWDPEDYPANYCLKFEFDSNPGVYIYYLNVETNETSKVALTPGTICKIDFETKEFQFVIVDGGKIEAKPSQEFCYHNYTIQELICYLREVFVQTSFFSNNVYSAQEFFTRLFALSDSDLEIKYSTAEDFHILLDNWKRADYQIASNSLLDNMIKIGMNNQVRPKARVDSLGRFEIYFKNLKGSRVISTISGNKISWLKQYQGTNFASKVVANVSNLSTDQEFWFPENNFEVGMLAEPESNSSISVESTDGLVLCLPYPIKSASSMRAIGVFALADVANYYLYDKNQILISNNIDDYNAYIDSLPVVKNSLGLYRNITGVAAEIPVVEYKEWLRLTPDDREITAYYKRGERYIYNFAFLDGDTFPYRNVDFGPIYYTENIGLVPIYQHLFPHLNYYIIKCNLFHEGNLLCSNDSATKRTTFYSQEDNIVSGKSLIDNMQNYIDSMKNEEESLTYEFNSIDDLPQTGDIYNGDIISQVAFEVSYGKIKATLASSDELVKKSEYLSADSGLNLPGIPVHKAYERIKTYGSILWFCRSISEAEEKIDKYETEEYLQGTFMENALDAPKNGRAIEAAIPTEILMKTGAYESDPVYTALDVGVKAVNSVLLISWKTRDNSIAGVMVDKTLNPNSVSITDIRYYPISFINETGLSRYVNYKIINGSVRNSEGNYPAISEATFVGAINPLVTIDDLKYYHDPAEVINSTLQITFKTFHSEDKVTQTFLEDSSLMNDTLNQTDPYIRYVYINSILIEILAVTLVGVSPNIYRIKIDFSSSLISSGVNNIQICRKTVDGDREPMLTMNLMVYADYGDAKYIYVYVAKVKDR